ncbi:hypothetical protein FOCC_FOCC006914 [Frankliniella occidentalis]|nr:hypothetical protein FOCC_FOCC006914 [Frankliniella occidentalis]
MVGDITYIMKTTSKTFIMFMQESYRRWVCSSLLPHFPRPGGPRVRPCRSVCRSVEQKCPFFLPGDRAPAYPTQYAGEPTFLCLDPNIPESGEQMLKSSYGEDDCCYRHCNERGLPWLCPSDTSCLEKPPEKTPLPVVDEDYDIGIVLFLLGLYAVKLDLSQGLLPVIPNVKVPKVCVLNQNFTSDCNPLEKNQTIFRFVTPIFNQNCYFGKFSFYIQYFKFNLISIIVFVQIFKICTTTIANATMSLTMDEANMII